MSASTIMAKASRLVNVGPRSKQITYSGDWLDMLDGDSFVGRELTSRAQGSITLEFEGTHFVVNGRGFWMNGTIPCRLDGNPFRCESSTFNFYSPDPLPLSRHLLEVNFTNGTDLEVHGLTYVPYVMNNDIPAQASAENATIVLRGHDMNVTRTGNWERKSGTVRVTHSSGSRVDISDNIPYYATNETGNTFNVTFYGIGISGFLEWPSNENTTESVDARYYLDAESPVTLPNIVRYDPNGDRRGIPIINRAVCLGTHTVALQYMGVLSSSSSPLRIRDEFLVQLPKSEAERDASLCRPPRSNANSVGTIVGGVMGGIAALAIALAAFFFYRRRKRRPAAEVVMTRASIISPYETSDGANTIAESRKEPRPQESEGTQRNSVSPPASAVLRSSVIGLEGNDSTTQPHDRTSRQGEGPPPYSPV